MKYMISVRLLFLAAYLLSYRQETANDQRTVGVTLAPGLGLLAKGRGVVNDEQSDCQIAIE